MRKIVIAFGLAAAVLACTRCTTLPSRNAVLPENTKWVDNPNLPGSQVAILSGNPANAGPFTARLKFPANFKVWPHRHPIDEVVTVISGVYRSGVGETLDAARLQAYPTGSFVVRPAGTPHFVWTEQETIIQVNGVGPNATTYVNPADDPRKK